MQLKAYGIKLLYGLKIYFPKWRMQMSEQWLSLVLFLVLGLASASSALSAYAQPYEVLLPKELNFDINISSLPRGGVDPTNNNILYFRYVYSSYLKWRGLYTPNLIQINLYHIYGNEELEDVIYHEIQHYKCQRDFNDIDYKHEICNYERR